MSIPFDPKRVSIIHLPGPKSPHLLVRGNMPISEDGSFTYSEIETCLNLDFSADRFVSVSLIDNTGERDSWALELQAFQASPNTFPKEEWPPYLHHQKWEPRTLLGSGTLVFGRYKRRKDSHLEWWPIEGMSPTDKPEVFLKAPGWDFSGVVEYLYGLYTNLEEPNTVIYFHCMLGADRTGAVHAGLLVRAGLDVETALALTSSETTAGPPSPDYQRLIRAYAESREN